MLPANESSYSLHLETEQTDLSPSHTSHITDLPLSPFRQTHNAWSLSVVDVCARVCLQRSHAPFAQLSTLLVCVLLLSAVCERSVRWWQAAHLSQACAQRMPSRAKPCQAMPASAATVCALCLCACHAWWWVGEEKGWSLQE